MRACQADQGGSDLITGSALGFLDRAGYRLGGTCDIHHRPLFYTLGRFDADADDTQPMLTFDAGHEGADLGCADINSDDGAFFHDYCSNR
jgi:hypothetical protein